ncbi:hypothetical protein [Kitasatospora sp. MMS16-BH015]|uniref:hypothetical protein n=1 Tax=Kitasatospora sp. MMS16-BH015 TaxID=2018025 RepID=UPI00131A54DA|nr:hypothetical protein [Kitasatospora sp. MMS16-BH015]
MPQTHLTPPPPSVLPEPAQPRPTNGAATAALVCGVIALVGGIVPGLNLVSGLVAIPAVVCGFVGLGKARRLGVGRRAAIGGILTGVLGLVLTVVVICTVFLGVDKAVKSLSTDTGSKVAGTAAATPGGQTAVLGTDAVKLGNGLEIAPAAPVAYTPGEYEGIGTGAHNYQVKVVFTNKGGKNVDLGLATATAVSDGGATRSIIDSGRGIGDFAGGTLAPGQSTTMTFGFSSETAPSYVNLDVAPGILSKAHFTYTF